MSSQNTGWRAMRGRSRLLPVLAAGCALAVVTACSGGAGSSGTGSSGTGSGGPGGGGTSSLVPTVAGTSTSVPETTAPNPTAAAASSQGSSTVMAPSTALPAGPAGSTSPPAGPGEALLRPGSTGPQVLALQRRLIERGYWLGTPDGTYGDLTAQAVIALQKLSGLSRDGIVGPRTRSALADGGRPKARSSSGHVAEIDLRHQVMLIVDGGTVTAVLNVSTGSGEYYTAPDGHRGHAVTPPGRYAVFRAVDGWDTSPLGHLYRPRYFNGGIAVHGYPSVPSSPASHGCVRVSLPAMDMIWSSGALPRGGAVWVY